MQLPLVNLLGEAVFRINDKVNNAARLVGTHDSSNLCSKKDGGWWFQKGKKLGANVQHGCDPCSGIMMPSLTQCGTF